MTPTFVGLQKGETLAVPGMTGLGQDLSSVNTSQLEQSASSLLNTGSTTDLSNTVSSLSNTASSLNTSSVSSALSSLSNQTTDISSIPNFQDIQNTIQGQYQNLAADANGLVTQAGAYEQEGKQILDDASQVVDDPTGPKAMALAAKAGVTLAKLGAQNKNAIIRAAVGEIAAVAQGYATGGPIGAIAAGIGWTISNLNPNQGAGQTTPPWQPGPKGGPDGPDLGATGTMAGHLYVWRQAIGSETNGTPIGYAMLLAWLQLHPIPIGSLGPSAEAAGCVTDTATNDLLATALGINYIPASNPSYADANIGFDTSQSVSAGSAPKQVKIQDFNPGYPTVVDWGSIGSAIFNNISDAAGGDTQASNALLRLPPPEFLDHVASGGPIFSWANQQLLGLETPTVYDGSLVSSPNGSKTTGCPSFGVPDYYLIALVTVLTFLEVTASDQAIASELKMQLHMLLSNNEVSLTNTWDDYHAALQQGKPVSFNNGPAGDVAPPVDKMLLRLIAYFDTFAGAGAQLSGASKPAAATAASGAGTAASSIAGTAAILAGLAVLGTGVTGIVQGVGFVATSKMIWDGARKWFARHV